MLALDSETARAAVATGLLVGCSFFTCCDGTGGSAGGDGILGGAGMLAVGGDAFLLGAFSSMGISRLTGAAPLGMAEGSGWDFDWAGCAGEPDLGGGGADGFGTGRGLGNGTPAFSAFTTLPLLRAAGKPSLSAILAFFSGALDPISKVWSGLGP